MTQEQNRDKPASGQGQSEKFRGHKPSKANFIPLGVDVLDCPDLDFLDAATLVFVSGRIKLTQYHKKVGEADPVAIELDVFMRDLRLNDRPTLKTRLGRLESQGHIRAIPSQRIANRGLVDGPYLFCLRYEGDEVSTCFQGPLAVRSCDWVETPEDTTYRAVRKALEPLKRLPLGEEGLEARKRLLETARPLEPNQTPVSLAEVPLDQARAIVAAIGAWQEGYATLRAAEAMQDVEESALDALVAAHERRAETILDLLRAAGRLQFADGETVVPRIFHRWIQIKAEITNSHNPNL